jgi:hypothetical protein
MVKNLQMPERELQIYNVLVKLQLTVVGQETVQQIVLALALYF